MTPRARAAADPGGVAGFGATPAVGPSAKLVPMTQPVYNVAHVLPWPSVGGTERATLRVAQAVEAEGFRSVAFCPGGESPVREMFRAAGFETAGYEGVPPSYLHPRAFLRNSFRLAR